MRLKNARKPYLKMSAEDVVAALKRRYPPSASWVFLTEVTFATGWSHNSYGYTDAMAFHCWPSEGFRRIAFEVKVSREDFKRELEDPFKRKNAVEYSNEFYFAVPKGLIDPFDVPMGCGLMEVGEDGELDIRIVSEKRKEAKFDYDFFIAAL